MATELESDLSHFRCKLESIYVQVQTLSVVTVAAKYKIELFVCGE